MSTHFLQRTCMKNNHRMHTVFSPLWNLFIVNGQVTCRHRIIRAFSKGNHIKLEVSHVTVKFSRNVKKKKAM